MEMWSAHGQRTEPLDLGATVLDQVWFYVVRADFLGEQLRLQYEDEGKGGLVGHVYAAGRAGERIATSEAARALVKMEAEARDRVVRYAKVAHDMGIDERVVQLETEKAQRVVGAVTSMLDSLGLSIEARGAAVDEFMERIGRSSVVAGEVVSASGQGGEDGR